MLKELPLVREAYGFRRTECGCELCKACCRHLPGTLDPSDLSRLCPPGQDVLAWAEQHLRAQTGKPYPALVPARGGDGHCHWYFEGKCAVHENAPYSCAFFDCHMDEGEVDRRVRATVQAIRDDMAANGLYSRVWLHLRQKGLLSRGGDRSALLLEMRNIQRRGERSLRRVQRP
jgi:hypothetical protein